MAEDETPVEISKDEFSRWLTPLQAYDLLHGQWSYDVICSTLRRLLGHGVLAARAGILKIRPNRDDPNRTLHCALVVAHLWEESPPPNSSNFWDNGLIDFADDQGYAEFACIDVRFEPDTIRGLIKVPVSAAPPPAAPGIDWAKLPAPKQSEQVAAQPVNPPSPPDKRPNLTAPEASKFCKLLLEGWPASTEREAHKRASGFFHEKKVPKHWFLNIFRSIRGDKNPGPQPKTGESNQ